jgi:hypothetical protein
MRATGLASLILFELITLTALGEEHNLLCSFLLLLVTSSPLSTRVLASVFFSDALILCSAVRDKAYNHKKQQVKL